jgi:hypothetical protein
MTAALGLAAFVSALGAPTPLPRADADRPDTASTPQVHAVYVLPADGVDRKLDTNGVIADSIANFERWLRGQTAGRELRLDTYQGQPDISFFRMSESDAQAQAHGVYLRDSIERELQAAGVMRPGKIYAVYYDGTTTVACGGGAWPPQLPGIVGAEYLRATYNGGLPCFNVELSRRTLQILDFGTLHELLHTLGFVPACAPHAVGAHVSDSPTDLMYAGPDPWQPSVLDFNHDDYFDAHIPACADLSDSPYLVPARTSHLSITIKDAVRAGRPRLGAVMSEPAAISCPPRCSADFDRGWLVTLHAQPRPSSVFGGWGGACRGRALHCTIRLQGQRRLQVSFAKTRHS